MKPQHIPRGILWRGIAVGFVVLGLVALEMGLSLLGVKPGQSSVERASAISAKYPELQAWCQVATFDEALAHGLIPGPLGFIQPDQNRGYRPLNVSDDRLVAQQFYEQHQGAFRVLVLGDSFTQGAGADPGQGYVELLSQHYHNQGIGFFNTGVGGYGQNNELVVLRELLPIIKPQLVLVGLYTGNDFWDNLTPLDRYTAFPNHWVTNYQVDITREGIQLQYREPDERLAIYKNTIGCDLSSGAWSHVRSLISSVVYKTRVGTKTWSLMDSLTSRLKVLASGGPVLKRIYHETSYAATRQLLQEMLTALEPSSASLMVLVIPDYLTSTTALQPSEEYVKALALTAELHILAIDPFPDLTLDDYRGRTSDVPDDHWNNSGHYKAFARIVSQVEAEFFHR